MTSVQVGSRHSDALIPASCDLRVCPDASNVVERDFETAVERPELVNAPDVQRQLAFCRKYQP